MGGRAKANFSRKTACPNSKWMRASIKAGGRLYRPFDRSFQTLHATIRPPAQDLPERVLFDVRVPVLLCVIIAGVVDAACFEEDSVGFNREGVCSNDLEILLGSIPICVDFVHREEGLPLVFAKDIDLLADRYP